MSNPLHMLTTAYQGAWAMVDDEDADLQSLEDTLTCIEDAIEAKAQNIAVFINKLDTDADVVKEEIKRLQKREHAMRNKSENIRNYLAAQMIVGGIEKVKTPTHTISLQNNPPAVQIHNPDIIPAKYLTIIPESYQPNKTLIKEDLKNGIDVPGASLSQGKSLRIR